MNESTNIARALPENLEWVFFDVDGTLWNHLEASMMAMKSMCARLKLDVYEFAQHYKRETEVVFRDFQEGRYDIATSRIVRFENILKASGLRIHEYDVEELAADYLREYLAAEMAYPRVKEVLTACASFANVAVLTNAAHETQDVKLLQFSTLDDYQFVLTTDETGTLKPDPEFYEAAEKLAGSPHPSRVLMVGDSWDADVKGAHDRGYWTAWIAPSHEEAPEELERLIRIERIHELLEHLPGDWADERAV